MTVSKYFGHCSHTGQWRGTRSSATTGTETLHQRWAQCCGQAQVSERLPRYTLLTSILFQFCAGNAYQNDAVESKGVPRMLSGTGYVLCSSDIKFHLQILILLSGLLLISIHTTRQSFISYATVRHNQNRLICIIFLLGSQNPAPQYRLYCEYINNAKKKSTTKLKPGTRGIVGVSRP